MCSTTPTHELFTLTQTHQTNSKKYSTLIKLNARFLTNHQQNNSTNDSTRIILFVILQHLICFFTRANKFNDHFSTHQPKFNFIQLNAFQLHRLRIISENSSLCFYTLQPTCLSHLQLLRFLVSNLQFKGELKTMLQMMR